jgi:hypothetical protein
MKKTTKIFSIIVIVLIICFYWVVLRRTAYTVANVLTSLNISKEFKVEKFEDNWLPNGDGESLIIFSFTKEQESNIIQSCLENKYKKLPISEKLPDNYIYNFYNESDSLGYYSLSIDNKDSRSYTICLVNMKNKQIIIYNSIY